jgi:hypothetical protein
MLTRQGSFRYPVTRLKVGDSSSNFFTYTNYFGNNGAKKGSYQSKGLVSFATKYAALMSYANTAKLITETCCGTTLSDQHIYTLVAAQADVITRNQKEQITDFEASGVKLVAEKTDIYDSKQKEVIYLTDDVCVKQQKSKRDKLPKTDKEGKFYHTRISMFETKDKTYNTIVAGISVDNTLLVKSTICKLHADDADSNKIISLPIVAISDGATTLKNELKDIFGENVTHILDWYHLKKKVYQTMSMIVNKTAREATCKQMLHLLWQGKSAETIACLQEITAKNETAKEMLITYLTKNETTIIDYERRSQAKKTIGSGRTEKQNDIIVAKRQKYNGMSWSPKGSNAMVLNNANYS